MAKIHSSVLLVYYALLVCLKIYLIKDKYFIFFQEDDTGHRQTDVTILPVHSVDKDI